MSARSSARDLSIAVAVLGLSLGGAAGCHRGPKRPQGDPAAFAALARTMIKNVPGAGMTKCTGEQILGGATMTMLTVSQIAKYQLPEAAGNRPFVNPPELDAPAARVLADDKASEGDRRTAAGELAAAPFYLVYAIDNVDVPMALGVKELMRGSANGRAIKYDQRGIPQCVRIFSWQNDKQLSDEAIAKSNKARLDPAIVKQLSDDLTAQLLKRIAALGAPEPPATEMARKPPE